MLLLSCFIDDAFSQIVLLEGTFCAIPTVACCCCFLLFFVVFSFFWGGVLFFERTLVLLAEIIDSMFLVQL